MVYYVEEVCGYNNKIQLKLIVRMQLLKSSPKRIYQFILSAKQPSQLLQECILALLRTTISSAQHFQFLLHRVNWFETPLCHYQPLLLKILRIYRSKSTQSSKVIYNLLIESLINQHSNQQALNCLAEIFEQSYDKKNIIHCLKQNYPHKLCSLQMHLLYLRSMLFLCQKFKNYRTDLLEIIIENLVNFDTQLVVGDEWVHRPFPDDCKIVQLRENSHQNQLAIKFDTLLQELLTTLNTLGDQQLLNQIFLVFQNKILPIKTTKLIQFVVFGLAEHSRTSANNFVSFLLGNIFDCNKKQNWYRIFTQSHFYLFSYILRSQTLTKATISKIKTILIQKLKEKINILPQIEISQQVQLKDLFFKNEMLLLILQTIIIIQLEDTTPNSQYEGLLAECSLKLHFQYFLREQILQKMGVSKEDNKNNLVLKYSNKFMPPTLPLTGKLIDSCMKLRMSQSSICPQLQQYEPISRKKHKGQTPVSNCSQTIVCYN